jgi:hypothetical protein
MKGAELLSVDQEAAQFRRQFRATFKEIEKRLKLPKPILEMVWDELLDRALATTLKREIRNLPLWMSTNTAEIVSGWYRRHLKSVLASVR